MINMVCPVCGKKFRANNDFQRTCSKSCAAILRERNKRKKKEEKNIDNYEDVPKREKCLVTGLQNFESRNKELISDAEEAIKIGMTYGQYSAIETKRQMKFKEKDKKPDMVEALRCKDCEYWSNRSGLCSKTRIRTIGLDYCSMGRRKNADE